MVRRSLVAVVVVVAAAGCVGPGMLTDGSSVSVGNHATGALRHGRRLPFRGEGYLMPRRWQDRQRNYGTDELVGLLVRAARRVNRQHPGALLGVADLSPRGGGGTPEHRSHRSGRDVDLLLYYTDLDGKVLPPTEMIFLNTQGSTVAPDSQPAGPAAGRRGRGAGAGRRPATGPGAPPTPIVAAASTAGATGTAAASGALAAPAPTPRKLDVPRSWAVIRALLTDGQVAVQWIFLGRALGQLLLQHARAKNEPAWLIERATAVMHQPSDAQTHMDHWHVRVFCSPSDRHQGCRDRGPGRWLKKDLKYLDTPLDPGPPLNLAQITLRPLRFTGL